MVHGDGKWGGGGSRHRAGGAGESKGTAYKRTIAGADGTLWGLTMGEGGGGGDLRDGTGARVGSRPGELARRARPEDATMMGGVGLLVAGKAKARDQGRDAEGRGRGGGSTMRTEAAAKSEPVVTMTVATRAVVGQQPLP